MTATIITMKNFLLVAFSVITLCSASEAGQVTLTVNNQPLLGVVILSEQVTIATNETATVMSLKGSGSSTYIRIIKSGITNMLFAAQLQGGGSSIPLPLPTVAGPATLQLVILGGGTDTWNCTVKIEPESFPPDKTIIIPQGTPGANIIMEQSTDLVNWTNSVPGLYTNTAINHLFFRLRAERL